MTNKRVVEVCKSLNNKKKHITKWVVLKEAALDLILTSLKSTHKKKSSHKKQKYLTLINISPSFWKPKPNNEALSSWYPMVVIWTSYWTCSYNESSIHPSIRSPKLPNTRDAKVFQQICS